MSRKENQKASPVLPKQNKDKDKAPSPIKSNQIQGNKAGKGTSTQGVVSPAGTHKLGAPVSSSSASGKVGMGKGVAAEVKSGHQPKMKQGADRKEDKHSTKEGVKNHTIGETVPRKIEFSPPRKDKVNRPEDAIELKESASGRIPEIQKTALAVDKGES
ncbi:unnamed protein product [Linum trigynum]|uniref:Uncharacterized protein n=1 Tax=Linum trigynum TaxID=586398 RepID=A0AAV2GUZ3_9ROSI